MKNNDVLIKDEFYWIIKLDIIKINYSLIKIN